MNLYVIGYVATMVTMMGILVIDEGIPNNFERWLGFFATLTMVIFVCLAWPFIIGFWAWAKFRRVQ